MKRNKNTRIQVQPRISTQKKQKQPRKANQTRSNPPRPAGADPPKIPPIHRSPVLAAPANRRSTHRRRLYRFAPPPLSPVAHDPFTRKTRSDRIASPEHPFGSQRPPASSPPPSAPIPLFGTEFLRRTHPGRRRLHHCVRLFRLPTVSFMKVINGKNFTDIFATKFYCIVKISFKF